MEILFSRMLLRPADYQRSLSFYRDEIGALHRELTRAGEPHEHLVVPGPHDYPFNRGPGAIEMLLWHDRQLRGG